MARKGSSKNPITVKNNLYRQSLSKKKKKSFDIGNKFRVRKTRALAKLVKSDEYQQASEEEKARLYDFEVARIDDEREDAVHEQAAHRAERAARAADNGDDSYEDDDDDDDDDMADFIEYDDLDSEQEYESDTDSIDAAEFTAENEDEPSQGSGRPDDETIVALTSIGRRTCEKSRAMHAYKQALKWKTAEIIVDDKLEQLSCNLNDFIECYRRSDNTFAPLHEVFDTPYQRGIFAIRRALGTSVYPEMEESIWKRKPEEYWVEHGFAHYYPAKLVRRAWKIITETLNNPTKLHPEFYKIIPSDSILITFGPETADLVLEEYAESFHQEYFQEAMNVLGGRVEINKYLSEFL